MNDIPLTIGGEQVAVPAVMNFAGLKAAWPAIETLGRTQDPIERMSAAVAVIAAAVFRVRPELTAAEIEARLATHEMAGLVAVLPALFRESGLVPSEATRPGEARPAEPGSTI